MADQFQGGNTYALILAPDRALNNPASNNLQYDALVTELANTVKTVLGFQADNEKRPWTNTNPLQPGRVNIMTYVRANPNTDDGAQLLDNTWVGRTLFEYDPQGI